MANEIEHAVDLLRANGWTVIPPAPSAESIPEQQAGQVWASPKLTVNSRTIVKVESGYGAGREDWVHFTSPGDYSSILSSIESWKSWARNSGARPVLQEGA